MAVLVFWTKADETATTVSYTFGQSPEEQPARLTVDQSTGELTSVTGPLDQLAPVVVGKSRAAVSRTGSWPERGGHQG